MSKWGPRPLTMVFPRMHSSMEGVLPPEVWTPAGRVPSYSSLWLALSRPLSPHQSLAPGDGDQTHLPYLTRPGRFSGKILVTQQAKRPSSSLASAQSWESRDGSDKISVRQEMNQQIPEFPGVSMEVGEYRPGT